MLHDIVIKYGNKKSFYEWFSKTPGLETELVSKNFVDTQGFFVRFVFSDGEYILKFIERRKLVWFLNAYLDICITEERYEDCVVIRDSLARFVF